MAQGVNLHVTCQGGEELLIAPPGQPAVELISEDGSVFHTKTGNMRIRFVSGTDGEIERLDLDTGHSEVRYLRVRPKSRTAGQ